MEYLKETLQDAIGSVQPEHICCSALQVQIRKVVDDVIDDYQPSDFEEKYNNIKEFIFLTGRYGHICMYNDETLRKDMMNKIFEMEGKEQI